MRFVRYSVNAGGSFLRLHFFEKRAFAFCDECKRSFEVIVRCFTGGCGYCEV